VIGFESTPSLAGDPTVVTGGTTQMATTEEVANGV
jgi:hypothetical protein